MRVPVGRIPVKDIRPSERLLLTFDNEDRFWPRIYSLRADFPTTVTHLNAPMYGSPPTLCVSVESYVAFRRRATPGRYIELIRRWLSETARGELHAAEQPLEPFLLEHAPILIVPARLQRESANSETWFAQELTPDVFRMSSDVSSSASSRVAIHLVIAPARVHAAIAATPQNLAELAALVDIESFSLKESVKRATFDWIAASRRRDLPLLLLQIPLAREEGRTAEQFDIRAFRLGETVESLGVALGIVDAANPSGFLLGTHQNEPAPVIEIELFNVQTSLSRELAALYNGESTQESSFVLIGAGALGSQVAENLTRGGAVPLAIIDEDRIFPHNLARHALTTDSVGFPKATRMASFLDGILDENKRIEGITADVLLQDVAAMHATDTIFDISASVDVARHLSTHEPGFPRSVSLFLNPRGTDLILLAEDVERDCRLDMLEMQYYCDIATREDLAGHLSVTAVQRYGAGCRERSAILKQTSIAVFAGIGAAAFRRVIADRRASAQLWRLDEATSTVSRIELGSEPMPSLLIGKWSVFIARRLLRQFSELRKSRLPNETGGVLMGSVDMQRGIIYAVGMIESPRDSVECPTGYIRGAFGLESEISRISSATLGNLEYLGEWHSHPPGHTTDPSSTDDKLYEWLTETVLTEGIPATMFIVGASEVGCLVDGKRAVIPLEDYDDSPTRGVGVADSMNMRSASPS
jgi:hypothetical protein